MDRTVVLGQVRTVLGQGQTTPVGGLVCPAVLSPYEKAVQLTRERNRERKRAWRAVPENREAERAAERVNRRGKPRQRSKGPSWGARLYKLGMTRADYLALVEAQGGVCRICGSPETVRIFGKVIRLAVDHDHETGRVRGLVCHKCNRRLAWFDAHRDRILEHVLSRGERT